MSFVAAMFANKGDVIRLNPFNEQWFRIVSDPIVIGGLVYADLKGPGYTLERGYIAPANALIERKQ